MAAPGQVSEPLALRPGWREVDSSPGQRRASPPLPRLGRATLRTLPLLLAAAITVGCGDASEQPSAGGGVAPIEPLIGESGDIAEPFDSEAEPPEPPDFSEWAKDDPWFTKLDHAAAWQVTGGFVVAGFDPVGIEIGRITVTAPRHEIIIADHFYPRPCEDDEIECSDIFVATIDYDLVAVDRQFNDRLPVQVLERRSEALAILAGRANKSLIGDRLKCALSTLPPIAGCARGSPLGCALAFLAAACECKTQSVRIFPRLESVVSRVCE